MPSKDALFKKVKDLEKNMPYEKKIKLAKESIIKYDFPTHLNLLESAPDNERRGILAYSLSGAMTVIKKLLTKTIKLEYLATHMCRDLAIMTWFDKTSKDAKEWDDQELFNNLKMYDELIALYEPCIPKKSKLPLRKPFPLYPENLSN